MITIFSVIVPMYNVEKYAEKCIESILSQTFTNFELILVDDGSQDNTGKIIDYYKNKDSRIRVIHKNNGGLTSARKAGTLVASKDYIIIIDGDDWVDSDYIAKISEAIDKDHPDVVITGYTRNEESHEQQIKFNGIESGVYSNENTDYVDYIRYRLIYASPTVWAKCFKKEMYLPIQMGLDDSINMGEDGCISYPIIATANKVSVINNFGYHYRCNPASLTRNKQKIIPYESALRRIKHLKKTLPTNENIDMQMAGYTAHAIFNAISTNMKVEKYRKIVQESKNVLNDCDVAYYLHKKCIGSKKELLAHKLLKHKMLIVIKIYTLLLD